MVGDVDWALLEYAACGVEQCEVSAAKARFILILRESKRGRRGCTTIFSNTTKGEQDTQSGGQDPSSALRLMLVFQLSSNCAPSVFVLSLLCSVCLSPFTCKFSHTLSSRNPDASLVPQHREPRTARLRQGRESLWCRGGDADLSNEQATWETLVAYVRQEHVDCEPLIGDTYDVTMTPRSGGAGYGCVQAV